MPAARNTTTLAIRLRVSLATRTVPQHVLARVEPVQILYRHRPVVICATENSFPQPMLINQPLLRGWNETDLTLTNLRHIELNTLLLFSVAVYSLDVTNFCFSRASSYSRAISKEIHCNIINTHKKLCKSNWNKALAFKSFLQIFDGKGERIQAPRGLIDQWVPKVKVIGSVFSKQRCHARVITPFDGLQVF
jgi:hypothetical protein